MISVVQNHPGGQGYNVHDLERIRVGHVKEAMKNGDSDMRRKHVELLKFEKRIKSERPTMLDYWRKIVGEKDLNDAIAFLSQEADAEIAHEAMAASVAATAKKR